MLDSYTSILESIKKDDIEEFESKLTPGFDFESKFNLPPDLIPDILKDGACWIHFIVHSGAVNIARLTLPNVNPKIVDENRRALIHFAAASNNSEMFTLVETFTSSRDILDADNFSVACYAVFSLEILEYLWMTGYEFRLLDLTYAAQIQACDGFNFIFDILYEEYEKVDITVFFLPLQSVKWQVAHKIYEHVTEKGLDLTNLKDPNGRTPLLHYFVYRNDFRMVKELIPFINDFDLRDSFGWTAYEIAAKNSFKNIIKAFDDFENKKKQI
ncbi:hypothetical protein TVAG_010660 [Trichomonas vaginalis G3]|uniref:DUF3447 domain-containing protein n=1 Tax=Trichomonas vaginalis (strain ATCC PRA-98 / G3) TaxID=412133 RepID=A2DNZ3_TRIV3|nr:Ankyrin repeat family [Trichomonas vaginalis G3]EAY17842.1 hypothetical protein TVAG_010660 [Trichomonas vaginalis G3]KAI5489957.1 Ankyrin repeat family [Trichomonas vaginalis G3]|eukprot:XP_001329977.1 hypothetical protein [Trichomonas vaginalis G3]